MTSILQASVWVKYIVPCHILSTVLAKVKLTSALNMKEQKIKEIKRDEMQWTTTIFFF